MVSIHKVPVIVYLIIRVISSTFRFKRGADFAYLIEGCGKTQAKINDTIPHTWIVWGRYAESVQPHSYTRNECCSLSFCL